MSEQITVVIPTYHRADTVARAVRSALLQTADVNVIVVDDNGKGTEEQNATAKALLPYQSYILYLVNDVNSKPAYSRNRGLSQSDTRYITFLDDDDEIAPDKLEKQAAYLDEMGEEYSCCMCGFEKLLSHQRVYHSAENAEGYVYPYALAHAVLVGSGSNLLYCTQDVKNAGGYDEDFHAYDDFELMVKVLKNKKLANLHENLLTVHYEVRDKVWSYEELKAADEKWLSHFKEEIDSLPENERKAVRQTLALDRWRYALTRHALKDADENMKKEGIIFTVFMKYIAYLTDRVVHKKVYGFKLV